MVLCHQVGPGFLMPQYRLFFHHFRLLQSHLALPEVQSLPLPRPDQEVQPVQLIQSFRQVLVVPYFHYLQLVRLDQCSRHFLEHPYLPVDHSDQ